MRGLETLREPPLRTKITRQFRKVQNRIIECKTGTRRANPVAKSPPEVQGSSAALRLATGGQNRRNSVLENPPTKSAVEERPAMMKSDKSGGKPGKSDVITRGEAARGAQELSAAHRLADGGQTRQKLLTEVF